MTDHMLWLALAALIVGLSKGGLASAGSLAVPLLALFMNPVAAAALLLPVFLVTDWFAVWLYRRDYSGRNLAILVPSALAGIVIATMIVSFTPESLLLILTAAVGFWYCLTRWFGRGATAPPRKAEIPSGIFWGILTGITTFITHSGAPPSQAFLLPQKLPRLVFAGTIAISFAITNLAKLPGYYTLGYFDGLNTELVVILTLVGLVGTAAGRWVVQRLNDQIYVRVIEGLLFTLSLVLFWKAWTLVAG